MKPCHIERIERNVILENSTPYIKGSTEKFKEDYLVGRIYWFLYFIGVVMA